MNEKQCQGLTEHMLASGMLYAPEFPCHDIGYEKGILIACERHANKGGVGAECCVCANIGL